MYSHLSNKRGLTFIDFEKKFYPPQTFPPSTIIDFLDFFQLPLLVYCSYSDNSIKNTYFLPIRPKYGILNRVIRVPILP